MCLANDAGERQRYIQLVPSDDRMLKSYMKSSCNLITTMACDHQVHVISQRDIPAFSTQGRGTARSGLVRSILAEKPEPAAPTK